MNLIVLDKDFKILGPVPLFETLIWTRRYQKAGSFELYTAMENFPMLRDGKYLYRNDAAELGVIDDCGYSKKESGQKQAYAKGYFAEKILSDRCIESTTNLKGNLEEVMRSLVEKFAINPTDSDRVIEHLKLGDLSGLGYTIESQITGADLSEELYDLCNVEKISYRIRYEYLTDDLLFEVWEGLDRRDSQRVNSWAIFSDKFYNIRGNSYDRNKTDYKNVAFVAGEENDGEARKIVEVDIRDDPAEERRELYVDARDLQSENDDGSTMTDAEYTEVLKARGQKKLAEYPKSESVESSIDTNANLRYKEDFDLGDWCDYIDAENGVEMESQITEIEEMYEGNAMTLYVTFGDEGVTTFKQLVKREAV